MKIWIKIAHICHFMNEVKIKRQFKISLLNKAQLNVHCASIPYNLFCTVQILQIAHFLIANVYVASLLIIKNWINNLLL